MPARDPLELRRYQPTVPDDLKDPPRLAQLVETCKDALVLELRSFFSDPKTWPEKRSELPVVEKYAVGFGTGLDPYQTFVQIYEEFPDVTERMPHIAVTTAAGTKSRLVAGRPFVGHTQAPPRVVTGLAEPYNLSNPVPQVSVITLASLVVVAGTTYAVTLDGLTVSYVSVAGDDANAVLRGLGAALLNAAGLVYMVSVVPGVSGGVLVQARTAGTPFSLTVASAVQVALVQAAGNAAEADKLVFRTTPNGSSPVVSVVSFVPSRFASSEPLSAVPALALARVFNEQSLYAFAHTVPVGVGTGVQFETGGRMGFHLPNEIEVLASSTPSLVAALGLGVAGVGAGSDAFTGLAPSLTVTLASGAFNSGMVGRYFTCSGATTAANSGRFLILSVPSSTSLVLENPAGRAEAVPASGFAWFIGARDDSTNPLRPAMNRYMVSANLQITIDVLAESPNVRREVLDLLLTEFMFYLELKFFTLYGRGTFDEDNYPDEHYQVIIHQEVQDGGEADIPRGEDQKDRIHSARVIVPCTITWYADRPVLVPSGPSAGRQWTLEAANVSYDPNLPMPT